MIKTAVVILNWNGLGWLKKFMPSVISFSAESDTAVYMADNGSTDGSADWVTNNINDVRVIRFNSNHGFAGGYNKALKQIRAKYFVLLNSDVEVTENWLKPLTEFMDQNPEVASCQPKVRSFYRKEYFEYAGAAGGYIDKFGYTFCRGRIFDHVEKDNGQYDNYTDIFWSTGACMMVRSDAWSQCGGFDEDFFAHMEEVDLCWRFHLAGFRISYVPDSVVYHAGGGALSYDSGFKTYLNFRNNLFLLYKNLPDNKLQSTIFIRKLMDGVAALMFIFKCKAGSTLAVGKAHVDYYKSKSSLKSKRKSAAKLIKRDALRQMLNKSIVIRFYIKGEKTFSRLTFKN